MPRAAKDVLTCLADHVNPKTGRTFVGHDLIAAETGMSVRTVIRAMKLLEAHHPVDNPDGMGWITRERRYSSHGHRTSNMITVHDPEAVVAAQAAMLRLPLMRALDGGKAVDEQPRLSDTVSPRPKCHGVTVRNQDSKDNSKIKKDLGSEVQPVASPSRGTGSAGAGHGRSRLAEVEGPRVQREPVEDFDFDAILKQLKRTG